LPAVSAGHTPTVNFEELGKKAKDFLDSEEGEKRSDEALDKAAQFVDEKTGDRYDQQVAKGRDLADERIGRTDEEDPRP
jgi:MT0933-like antitoxin protein